MLDTLKRYCSLHATPGDEAEVFAALLHEWKAQGLDTRAFGSLAVCACPGERKKSDTLLLVAHADCPGFTVPGSTPRTWSVPRPPPRRGSMDCPCA